MTYTEVKKRGKKKYYYRVKSIRKGDKVTKKRKYLGSNLKKRDLKEKEKKADKELMKNSNIELKKLKPKISKILKKYKIRKAGLFGSYVRGEQKKNSDIDILIQPPKGMGLDFVDLQFELREKLNKKVDLLTYNGIHPMLKKRILKEEERIV